MNSASDRRYLDLLKKSLSNELYLDMELRIGYLLACIQLGKSPALEVLIHPKKYMPDVFRQFLDSRKVGRVEDFKLTIDWQATVVSHIFNYYYHTCIGDKRLDNIEHCIRRCVDERIPGDVIETGVWRGGAGVYMQAVLTVCGATDRNVWLADSFEGYPVPKLPQDTATDYRPSNRPDQVIYQEEVEDLFERYGLLAPNVRFLKGWFKDTLPAAPIDRLSVLRLDGNLYESTWDSLSALYSKVSKGGFVIVDDYGAIPACKQAVHDFVSKSGLTVDLVQIDNDSVYWRV